MLNLTGHKDKLSPFETLKKALTKKSFDPKNIEKKALIIVWSMEWVWNFLLGLNFFLKLDHELLEFIFNPRKELPRIASSRILRWTIKLLAFNFDIMYIKGNIILYVDALSRLEFENEMIESHKNAEDKILHWVEVDMLPMNQLRIERRQDPVLSKLLERIKKNTWSSCSMAAKIVKEIRQINHLKGHHMQWRH